MFNDLVKNTKLLEFIINKVSNVKHFALRAFFKIMNGLKRLLTCKNPGLISRQAGAGLLNFRANIAKSKHCSQYFCICNIYICSEESKEYVLT